MTKIIRFNKGFNSYSFEIDFIDGKLLIVQDDRSLEPHNHIPIEIFEYALDRLNNLSFRERIRLLLNTSIEDTQLHELMKGCREGCWDTKKIISPTQYLLGCQIITKECIKEVIDTYYKLLNQK